MSNHEHMLETAMQNHLLPLFDVPRHAWDHAAAILHRRCRLVQTVKYQLLEYPGESGDGQFMLVLGGLVDSFYRCGFTEKLWGRHIYYRHDPIIDLESYHHNKARTDYIRALEPSTVLSLPYASLRALEDRHSEVKAKLQLLSALNTQQLLEYNLRNTLPADARIRAFLEKHPTLPHRTTAEVCAMHNHMSRYWYSRTAKDMM